MKTEIRAITSLLNIGVCKNRGSVPLNFAFVWRDDANAGRATEKRHTVILVRAEGLEPSQPCGLRIFLPLRLSPPRMAGSWSGLSLHHALAGLGAARLVSTPSRNTSGLGSGLPFKVSPTLGSSTPPVSRRALNFRLSPLRLPISPRPHEPGRQVSMIKQARRIYKSGC